MKHFAELLLIYVLCILSLPMFLLLTVIYLVIHINCIVLSNWFSISTDLFTLKND